MAIDPTTGRIITSSSLTIAEADAKRIPRNQALGPSRTAQERKQIRTALLAQWEGLASNPVIVQILEDLANVEQNGIYSFAGGPDGGLAILTLPRAEDGDGDPLFYAIEGELIFYSIQSNVPGIVNFDLSFTGTQFHQIAFHAIIDEGPGISTPTTAYQYQEGSGSSETFSMGGVPGDAYIRLKFSGRIAVVSNEVLVSTGISGAGSPSVQTGTSLIRASLTTDDL